MGVPINLKNFTAKCTVILEEDIVFNTANTKIDGLKTFFLGKGKAVESIYKLENIYLDIDYNYNKFTKEVAIKEICNAIQQGVTKFGDKFIFDEDFARKVMVKILRTKLGVKRCRCVSWKGFAYYQGEIPMKIGSTTKSVKIISADICEISLPIYCSDIKH